jgi:hypothetical protein
LKLGPAINKMSDNFVVNLEKDTDEGVSDTNWNSDGEKELSMSIG